MLTREDEAVKGEHLKASSLEFMEMVCRVCNEASFPPPPEKDEDGELIESTMSLADRK